MPLKFVNCYLIHDATGWTVVDVGAAYAPARSAWRQAWRRLGIVPGDISRIIVTHAHPDHLGLAGWMHKQTGAPVYMLQREIEVSEQTWIKESGPLYADWFRRHGMPKAFWDDIDLLHQSNLSWFAPGIAGLRPLQPGNFVQFGGRNFRVLWCPGHSDGQLGLFDENTGLLFCGDHLLPRITPNVSAFPDHDPNPLGSFLDALRVVLDLPVGLVLPGHGEPFAGAAERASQLLAHHEQRLRAVSALTRSGTSAWELTQALFGDMRSLSECAAAVGEVIAHLEYLVCAGALIRQCRNAITYTPA